jgi:hypothetical protein
MDKRRSFIGIEADKSLLRKQKRLDGIHEEQISIERRLMCPNLEPARIAAVRVKAILHISNWYERQERDAVLKGITSLSAMKYL